MHPQQCDHFGTCPPHPLPFFSPTIPVHAASCPHQKCDLHLQQCEHPDTCPAPTSPPPPHKLPLRWSPRYFLTRSVACISSSVNTLAACPLTRLMSLPCDTNSRSTWDSTSLSTASSTGEDCQMDLLGQGGGGKGGGGREGVEGGWQGGRGRGGRSTWDSTSLRTASSGLPDGPEGGRGEGSKELWELTVGGELRACISH